ncbi:hypothetical protein G7046_g7423 [Stylonectria norvegica]|nr:hypothetical protein G7046_g7423 [Stylonectria norvegica]
MSPGTVSPLSTIKALTFDVFGTTVDWRSTVTEELKLRAHRKLSSDLPIELKTRVTALTEDDWSRFAHEWHGSYGAFTRSFKPGESVWKTVDEHFHESLISMLESWGLTGVYSPSEIKSLSLVWHRLTPWPDSADGIKQLGTSGNMTTATLTNGNLELLGDLVDFGNLPFQKLLCAELYGAYKPNPATYLGAAHELGLAPGDIAMVAAHLSDLKHARSCGMRTVYIERSREEAWAKTDERYQQAKEWVDLWITEEEDGILTLARKIEELH